MTSSDLPTIGPYRLGQDYAAVADSLTEAKPAAYAALATAFDDEELYDGQPVPWLGRSWDTLLAVTGGRIYKLCLGVQVEDEDLADLYQRVLADLMGRFGDPSESKKDGGHLIWDRAWGNVVLSYLTVATAEGINVFYTWGEPFASVPRRKALGYGLRFHLGKACLSRRFRENVLTKWSDEEKSLWIRLRAIEWAQWPLFITQPIVPVLVAFMVWWLPVAGVLALSWLWALVRTHFVSVTILRVGVYFVRLKWPVSIGMAIYLAVSGRYWTAALAGLWPVAAAFLQTFTPRNPQRRRVEAALVARLMQPATKGVVR